MNILMVATQSFITSGDGIASYSYQAVQSHLAAGHHVHLLTANNYDLPERHFSAPNFKSTVLPSKEMKQHARGRLQNGMYYLALSVADHVQELVQSEDFDIIEGTEFLSPLHALLARKNAGLIPKCPPVMIFNHGLSRDFHLKTAVLTPDWQLRHLWNEEQSTHWADGVVAPSQHAYARMSRLLKSDETIYLIREPFIEKPVIRPTIPQGRFLHFGRLSVLKAVDLLAYFLNNIRPYWAIEAVSLIGSDTTTTFKEREVRDYIRKRIHPELRPKLVFRGRHNSTEARMIAADSGFHVNFSRHETFSYAQLETIFGGIAPVVLEGSAMSEFVPQDLKAGVLSREDFCAGNMKPMLEFWSGENSNERMTRLQEHAAELTAPDTFTAAYADMVRSMNERRAKQRVAVQAGREYKSSDITVLVCTYNDAHLLNAAIASIDGQTMPVAHVIVYDDGSFDKRHIDLLKRIEQRPNTTVIRGTNVGLQGGRARLLKATQTDLLVYLDADDYLDPQYMEKTLQTLSVNPGADAVITYRHNFGSSDELVTDFLLGSPYHWALNDFRMTALLKTEVVRELGFDEFMKNGEADDWHFWLRFTVNGHKAAFCPLPLFRYRFAAGSMSWPWCEGQAAFTTLSLQEVICEAAEKRVDLTEAMCVLHETATNRSYRLGQQSYDADIDFIRALTSSRWLALGTILKQAGPLRDTIADPVGKSEDLRNHLRNSRWMKLGRKLGFSRELDRWRQ